MNDPTMQRAPPGRRQNGVFAQCTKLLASGEGAGKRRFAHLTASEIEAKKKCLVPKSTQQANDLAARMLKDYIMELGTVTDATCRLTFIM